MKLTKREAIDFALEARKVIDKHPYIRLGQAIMNILPKEVAENLVWGETDFYYWECETDVLETFYKECVED